MGSYLLVLDAGSTNVKASLIDRQSRVFSSASAEFPVLYPDDGLVEESATVIWGTVVEMIRKVLTKSGVSEAEIHAIGVTNQRETFVVWDRKTGVPIYNAIGWQDKRGVPMSQALIAQGQFENAFVKNGQFLANFMPTGGKLTWVLDNVEGARERAERGELAFGTIDSWIVWNLTGGTSHVTDVSNASRTFYYNINTMDWDEELLQLFRIPRAVLPKVLPSDGEFGVTSQIFHTPIPIRGVLGDAHAATLGQRCLTPGMAKATYGTTCVMTVNIGQQPKYTPGIGTTVGWTLDGKTTYLYEGGFYVAGLTMKWMRDVLHAAEDYVTLADIAKRTPATPGLYLCPTFLGIATPHFCGEAKGMIAGLSVTSGMNDIIKAGLDSIAYTTRDCTEVFSAGLERPLSQIAVDGGVTNSDYIMQNIADITGISVVRAKNIEATTLGAAYAAGLASGYWKSFDQIEQELDRESSTFVPQVPEDERENRYLGWQKIVQAVLQYAK